MSWCPQCGSDAAAGQTLCLECGSEMTPVQGPVLGNRPCPRCKTPLREAREGTVMVDRCGTCRGAWYDRGELESILKAHAPAGPVDVGRARRELGLQREAPPVDPGYLPCAVCRDLMVRRNFGRFSGVLVDVCGRDGVWLDGGELEKLTAFAAKGGLAVGEDADRRDEEEHKKNQAAAIADMNRFTAARNHGYYFMLGSHLGRRL